MSKNMIRFGQVKGLQDEFAAVAAAREELAGALSDDIAGLDQATATDRAAIRAEFAAADTAEAQARIAGLAAAEDARGALEENMTGIISDKDAADVAARLVLTNDLASEVATRTSEVSRLDGRVDSVLSNTDQAALDSLTEVVAAFSAADGNLQTSITELSNTASTDRGAIRDEVAAVEQGLFDALDEKDGQVHQRISQMSELKTTHASWSAVEGGFESTEFPEPAGFSVLSQSFYINGLRVELGADKDYVMLPGAEGMMKIKVPGYYAEEIGDNSSMILRRIVVPLHGGGN